MAQPSDPEILQAMPLPPSLPKLTPKQDLAIGELLSGATDVEVALRLNVRRETINRWRHSDPDFIAEMNRRRIELWSASRDALRALVPEAIRVLRDALKDSDTRTRMQAALALLRLVGTSTGEPLQPAMGESVAPETVEQRWLEVAESKRQTDAMLAVLTP